VTARNTGNESWDAFWAEASGARTEVIRGVDVAVPRDIPFGFEERVRELSASSAREDIAELVTALFGAEVFDAWADAGMGYYELLTVLTWGMAQATGTDMTFAEAYQAVQEGDAEGKAQSSPNRAARRAQSKPTGGQSKRTSAASTASPRRRSAA
jgi:hypothetical protein